jgi:hypothetical protein
MDFWQNTWSNVLGGIGAGIFFLLGYLIIQWFLKATDLVVSYNWSYRSEAGAFYAWPNFDIRNRSQSRTYRIANIAYSKQGKPHWFDNKALWGFVLEPGSIHNEVSGSPVARITSLQDALDLEVTVTLQTGRRFWLRGQGPGQMGKGRIRRALFALRSRLESWMIALE